MRQVDTKNCCILLPRYFTNALGIRANWIGVVFHCCWNNPKYILSSFVSTAVLLRKKERTNMKWDGDDCSKYETSRVRRRWQSLDKGELSSGSPLSKNSELLPTIPAEIKLFTTSPTKNGLNQISQHTSSPTPPSTVTTGGNPKKRTQFWLLVRKRTSHQDIYQIRTLSTFLKSGEKDLALRYFLVSSGYEWWRAAQ